MPFPLRWQAGKIKIVRVETKNVSPLWKEWGDFPHGHVRFLGVYPTSIWSGQIIETSHDLTPNGGLVREIPLFQGNPKVGEIL